MKTKSLIGLTVVATLMLIFAALLTQDADGFVFGGNDSGATQSFSATNLVAANSTNTTAGAGGIGVAVDVSQYESVGLQVSGTNSTASTGTIFFGLLRSLDGVNFESAPVTPLTFTVTFAAGAQTLMYTNLNRDLIGSCGYLKLNTLNNSGAGLVGTSNTFQILIAQKRLAAPR